MRNLKVPQCIDTLYLYNFLTTEFLDILLLNEPLEFRREGLQQGIIDKLQTGKYAQQASLNLLLKPVEICRKLLFRFILEAQEGGKITGNTMLSAVPEPLPLSDRTARLSILCCNNLPDLV